MEGEDANLRIKLAEAQRHINMLIQREQALASRVWELESDQRRSRLPLTHVEAWLEACEITGDECALYATDESVYYTHPDSEKGRRVFGVMELGEIARSARESGIAIEGVPEERNFFGVITKPRHLRVSRIPKAITPAYPQDGHGLNEQRRQQDAMWGVR